MPCSPDRYLRTGQPPRETLLVRKLNFGPDTPLVVLVSENLIWSGKSQGKVSEFYLSVVLATLTRHLVEVYCIYILTDPEDY